MNTAFAHGKAILGFASLVITNLFLNYANNATPLPIEDGHLDTGALLINLLSIGVGTFSVYQWDNQTGQTTGKHEAK